VLYLKSAEGDVRIVVLETANIEQLKQGKPAKTPDGSVMIAWTPDPVWLADKIMDANGDAGEIGRLIDEASRRPQKPTNRPKHEPYVKSFLGG
jgi:hypothetical protein